MGFLVEYQFWAEWAVRGFSRSFMKILQVLQVMEEAKYIETSFLDGVNAWLI